VADRTHAVALAAGTRGVARFDSDIRFGNSRAATKIRKNRCKRESPCPSGHLGSASVRAFCHHPRMLIIDRVINGRVDDNRIRRNLGC